MSPLPILVWNLENVLLPNWVDTVPEPEVASDTPARTPPMSTAKANANTIARFMTPPLTIDSNLAAFATEWEVLACVCLSRNAPAPLQSTTQPSGCPLRRTSLTPLRSPLGVGARGSFRVL